ncbi:sulfotransferase family 2 domain-containing protein [Sphingomicrobium clamense]|uniref:Sulfotransferase family 2 domain-containing protein n=1 Tax=Sphingomicrobium clamense TaxID=2851013 RepID=A0ABS6V288_9SPHN|nr:sulfotransferase family 2 domain-containing protein [Sphingomicrobium sp. B8]MBW0143685.1 sulfotransferase family 2 domain-containing protein [Sphingomicrobium sp. B8]
MPKEDQDQARSGLFSRIAEIKPIGDFYDHTYISLRNKYLFHTVGKAANSTVKHVFYTIDLAGRRARMPSVHDRAASPLLSPFQLGETMMQDVLDDPQFTRFTFVRDPYSRLLSCYLDRIADKKSRPHAQFVRAMGKPVGYAPSFEEFIETVCAQPPAEQNNHWRVQCVDALVGVIPYDFIGKQESFDADMDKLVTKITGKPQEKVAEDVNASPSKTGSTSRLAEFFNKRTVELVQEAYARDFDELGYAREPEWLTATAAPKAAPAKPAKPPVRRSIRLKEFGANVSRTVSPTPPYLQQTNGTIEQDDYLIETDADGFLIAPEYRERQGDRIYVLGDSFVECSFIQQGKRICDVMNARMADGVAYNGGYSGSTTLNIYNGLLNRVLPHDPKHVIFVLPSNDVLALIEKGGFWNFGNKRYSPLVPIDDRDYGTDDFDENAKALAPLLALMCETARRFGFKLTLATMPFIGTDYDKENWFRIRHRTVEKYEGLADKRRKLNEVVRQVAAEQGVSLLDLESALPNDLYYDDVHVNARGAEVVAERLLAEIGKS